MASGCSIASDSGLAAGLSRRFNVNNLFDEDPSEYRRNSNLDYSEYGFTLGRLFKLGLTKTF